PMASQEATYAEQTRRVLTYAEEEARALNHEYIGTEHLLLGLLREEGSGAFKVLTGMSITLDRVRGGVLMMAGQGSRPPTGEITLTRRAKTAITLSAEEAQCLGSSSLEPEHLLVGLLREGEGLAATMLETLHMQLSMVRAALQPTADPIAAWACSFCGKNRDAVHRLIQGPGWVAGAPGDPSKQPLLICNECVTLCNEIIGKEEEKVQV
ncbi:MAG: Clp protease N-terminal domain-containing protein, partial [Chloroflexota bacterium]